MRTKSLYLVLFVYAAALLRLSCFVSAQTTLPPIVRPLPVVTNSLHTTGKVSDATLASGSTLSLDLLGNPVTYPLCNEINGKRAVLRVELHTYGDDGKFRSGGTGSDYSATVTGTIEAYELTSGGSTWIPLTTVAITISNDRPQGVFLFEQGGTLGEKIPFFDTYQGSALTLYPRYTQIRFVIDPSTGYQISGGSSTAAEPRVRLELACDVDYFVLPTYKLSELPTFYSQLVVRTWLATANSMTPIPTGSNPVNVVSNSLVHLQWGSLVESPCLNDYDYVEGWEVEVLRLYNVDPANATTPYQIFSYMDWSKALRVTTGAKDKAISLTLAEGEGFYVWRVRAKNGFWSETPPGGVILDGTNCLYGSRDPGVHSVSVFYHKPYDVDKNRSFARSFAPSFSRPLVSSEAIVFSNAIGQQRQVLSRDGSFPVLTTVTGSESFQDHEGRTTLSTISAPVGGVTEPSFVPLLNAVSGTSGLRIYSVEDFDGSSTLRSPLQIDPIVTLTPSGTHDNRISTYYSDENTGDLTIPNADGYPFGRTVVGTDGRVILSSAPGSKHRIGAVSKANTTSFIGTPSDAELVSVMGSEAPRADYVTKTLTIDPDGYGNITYTDNEGRPIITCLPFEATTDSKILIDGEGKLFNANSSTTGSHPLAEKLNNLSLQHIIQGGMPVGNGIWSASKSIVIQAPTDVVVNYTPSVRTATLSYGDNAESCSLCFTCDWMVEIRATLVNPTPENIINNILRSPDNSGVLLGKSDFVTCSFPAATTATQTVNLPTAGTWQFERIVRFNGPVALTPPDYSETRLEVLESNLSALVLPLSNIMNTLFPGAATDPEATQLTTYQTYLNSHVGKTPFVVEGSTECNQLALPAVQPCPVDDCTFPGNELEDYFVAAWLKSQNLGTSTSDVSTFKSTNNINKLFRRDVIVTASPSGANEIYPLPVPSSPTISGVSDYSKGWGVFNNLVEVMASSGYTCPQLWSAWKAAVASVVGGTQKDVLKIFLGIAGRKLDGVYSGGTNPTLFYDATDGYAFNAWRLIDCGTDATCGGYLPTTGPPFTSVELATTEAMLWGSDAAEVTRLRNEVGFTDPNKTWAKVRQKGLDNCAKQCEGRRLDFEIQARRQLLPATDEARVYCAVEALVYECLQSCNVAFPEDSSNIPNQATVEQSALRMYGRATVDMTTGTCPNDFTSAAGVSGFTRLKALAKYLTAWYNITQSSIPEVRCYNLAKKISDFYLSSFPNLQVPQCILDNMAGDEFTVGKCGTGAGIYRMNIFPGIKGIFLTESNPEDNCEDCSLIFYGVKDVDINHQFPVKLGQALDLIWGMWSDSTEVDWSGISSTRDSAVDVEYFERTTLSGSMTHSTMYLSAMAAMRPIVYFTTKGINGSTHYWDPVLLIPDLSFPGITGGNVPPIMLYSNPKVHMRSASDTSIIVQPFRNYGTLGLVFGEPGKAQAQKLIWEYDASDIDSTLINEIQMKHTTLNGAGWNASHQDNSNNVHFMKYNETFSNKLGTFGINADGFMTFTDKLSKQTEQINTVRFYLTERQPILGAEVECLVSSLCVPQSCGVCVKYESVTEEDFNELNYTDLTPASCEQIELRRIKTEIARRYLDAKAKLIEKLKSTYNTTCMDFGTFNDLTTISYNESFYHYTLAYYDRAGRLAKTVPPRGVDANPAHTRQSTPSSGTSPINHTMVTEFKYNSLNQMTTSTGPDVGTMEYFYDKQGRVRFTIDEVQHNSTPMRASYYKYDKMSRLVESGEYDAGPIVSGTGSGHGILYDDIGLEYDNQSFPPSTALLKDVKRFYYSVPASSVTGSGWTGVDGEFTTPTETIKQRFLRGRLSYAEAIPDATNTTNAEKNIVRTYFSYDEHGNTEWVVNDIPRDNTSGSQRVLKRTEFTYDITLGKVVRMDYQRDHTDRFIHSYEFDAKQRLIEVSTSHDDVIWKRDARYEYAKHGPMKRTLLGEDAVQGVDFTYTLHGQLKAINTPDRSPLTDPGQDGNTALTDVKDAFGLALNYYTDDFNRVGISVSSPFNTGGPAMLAPPVNLYGGLTGSMSWSTQAVLGTPTPIVRNQENIGETYRYDVLGRLRTVTTNKDNSGTFAAEATGGWSSQYTYDPHGNVLSVFKRGLDATATSIVLDDAIMELKPTGVGTSISNVIATVSDIHDDHGYGGQEVQAVMAGIGGSEIDEKGRVTKYSSASNAVETVFNANDLALSATRKDHTTTFLRDAFNQIVRQDVNYETTDNTFVTIPLGPLLSQAIYHYDGSEIFRILEWTIQDGNRIGVDRTTANTLVDGVNYRPVGDVLYELKDQVGSVRALVSDVVDEDPNSAGKYQAQVLSASDYEPFGSRRVNRYSELTSPYRYGWQGMTLMDGHEVRFDYVTPYRLYDTRVGRWTAIDPKVFEIPEWSPFVGLFCNPIHFIDPVGAFPWTLSIRSFISASRILLFVKGDGRGPKLSSIGVTSRVASTFVVDPANQIVSTPKSESSPSEVSGIPNLFNYMKPYPPLVDVATPTALISDVKFSDGTASFYFHHEGGDPLGPPFVTPDLDLHAGLQIKEDLVKRTLRITGTFAGDVFPSSEAFISDQSGIGKVFLGAKKEAGWLNDLFGNNFHYLFSVDMTVNFDKDGKFTTVESKGKTYSVEEWTKEVQSNFEK